MAIKSGNSATASDMNALKTALLTLYANRSVTVNDRTLSTTTAAPYSTVNGITATAGSSIAATQKGIIDGVLIINDVPNLLTQAQNEKILANGVSSTDLLSWVNQYKDATGTSTNHGCRGACVGICSGGCAGTNNGAEGENTNQTDYYGSCNKSCGSGCVADNCSTGCTAQNVNAQSQTCGTSCMGNCGTACKDTCYSGCNYSCSGTCSYGCVGCDGTCKGCGYGCSSACKRGCGYDCKYNCGANVCSTGCYSKCTDACQETCKDGCATDCTSGCYGAAKSGTYT